MILRIIIKYCIFCIMNIYVCDCLLRSLFMSKRMLFLIFLLFFKHVALRDSTDGHCGQVVVYFVVLYKCVVLLFVF